MPVPTVIVGAGGHAKVIIETMRQAGTYQPMACVAPTNEQGSCMGVPVVGDDDRLPGLLSDGISHAFAAVGDNHLRLQQTRRLEQLGFQLATVISPAALVAPSATIGYGSAVLSGAFLGTECTIAEAVIVNSNASVDHDCEIQEGCHLGPGVVLAGCVRVETLAFVATGSCVIPGQVVGAKSVVGAGSVVIRDIPAEMVAFGNPARPVRSIT